MKMLRRLEPREKRTIALGGVAAAAILAYALWPGSPSGGNQFTPQEPSTPAPLPQFPQAQSIAPAPAAAPASLQGITLHGLTGSGAILGLPGGIQRFVAVGRDIATGIRLHAVRQHHAVLSMNGGEVLLGFAGAAEPAGSTPSRPDGAPERAPAIGVPRTEAAHRDATLRYRLGLLPRRENGRVTGYTVRPGAQLPVLTQAGIRPGDVLLIDGEERLLELSRDIAAAYDFEIPFERNGRRMSVTVAVNPRT